MTKRKLTKAAAIAKMLNNGMTHNEILNRMKVSSSYIWLIKKQLASKAEDNDDNVVRPRVVGPHKTMRVTKAEAEALKLEAYAQATRGQPADPNSVDTVLTERGNDYGDYASKAQFIQGVKYLMRTSPSWEAMDADMRESMEMIAHKMGRVVYGDPTHKDNFVDIAGYATLVADRL